MLGFLKLTEQISDHSWNDASRFPLISSTHCEGFPASCLSIGEDSPIVPFKTIVDNWLCDYIKDIVLIAFFLEYKVEAKVMLLLD